MSKGKRYTEELQIEAVKQVTDRGESVQEIAERLGLQLNRCIAGEINRQLRKLSPYHLTTQLVSRNLKLN